MAHIAFPTLLLLPPHPPLSLTHTLMLTARNCELEKLELSWNVVSKQPTWKVTAPQNYQPKVKYKVNNLSRARKEQSPKGSWRRGLAADEDKGWTSLVLCSGRCTRSDPQLFPSREQWPVRAHRRRWDHNSQKGRQRESNFNHSHYSVIHTAPLALKQKQLKLPGEKGS